MKLLASIFFLFLLLSCKKNTDPENSNHCETWEYYETCNPKQPGIVCVEESDSTYPVRSKLCGDDLDSAGAGAVTIVYEDTFVVRFRHFLRKIN